MTKKIVTDLPELPDSPETAAWQIIEAHHSSGVTFWLVIVDGLWTTVARFGWRTGYIPTSEQIVNRAEKMLETLRTETSIGATSV